jgi:hypothetical protein
MNRVYLLCILGLGVLCVSACASKTETPMADEKYLNGNGVQVDLMQAPQNPNYDPRSTSMGAITYRASDGSVEIYNFEDTQPLSGYARANQISPIMQRSTVIEQATEKPFTPESGLEVFPLDEKMNQALRLPK